ncbi:MAG: Eco57I restriction-modification methylase domain-containing protein [Luteolibacter sp.]
MLTKARKSRTHDTTQELFPAEVFVGAAMDLLKSASGAERGAIFTKVEVVDFMLDLIGYTADRPLWKYRLLEPSFGGGEFLLKAIERLIVSAERDDVGVEQIGGAICGVELHRDSFEATSEKVQALLRASGISELKAVTITSGWLINDDFLLTPLAAEFDFVIGNPPYVRQELIPAELLAEYRQRYVTLYDRADLYVPFMERSLQLLRTDGQLNFICSDRWMKNRYGGPLRQMIADGYSMRYYVDMVGTSAFQTEVVAYPAITVIQKGISDVMVRIAHQPEISPPALSSLCKALTGKPRGFDGAVTELATKPKGDEPWLLEADAQPSLELVRRLEAAFPILEDAGCSVGIGVATGADKIYIGPLDELDVEDERKLPLVTTRDILTGTVQWRGLGVVNPFEEHGALADFANYPRFAAYMEKHRETLLKRHCAQRANGSWYRTIDRITPSLAQKPKLLIPDIKGEANIVLDESGLYPHHNLYYITSREWPLLALQRVMMSGIAKLFVRAYSTKMRGGCLRFQAQYLRRIRLPKWENVPLDARQVLARQSSEFAPPAIQQTVMMIYGLTEQELKQLTE